MTTEEEKTAMAKAQFDAHEDAKETALAGLPPWTPSEFKGNDLLPVGMAEIEKIEGVPEKMGRENINPKDLVMPAIVLLHGTSKAVQDGVENAEPGRFMHTGTEEVLPEGPLRAIYVHHHMGNALFPQGDDPRYDGLETCIAPTGVEGNRYGLCQECRKCLDWDEERNLKPLGAETHHFVAMTSWGPAMMRFSRSSFKSAGKFITSWKLSPKNLFYHPVVVRVKTGDKVLPSGKVTKYFFSQMAWEVTERIPPDVQRAAVHLYNEVHEKYETGNLKSQGEDDVTDELFG